MYIRALTDHFQVALVQVVLVLGPLAYQVGNPKWARSGGGGWG